MPTYDYQCPLCKEVKEIRHSIHVDPDLVCENPQCTGAGYVIIKRILTTSIPIRLKGSGTITYSEKQVDEPPKNST